MNFCDYHFLEGFRIAKYFLTIFKILIPIILIVMGIIDLSKSLMNPNDYNMAKVAKKFGLRIASAVIIFILPTIINLIFSLTTNVSQTMLIFNDCIKNANKEYIAVLKAYQKERLEANKKQGKEYEVNYSKDNLISVSNSDILATAEALWKNEVTSGKFTSYGGAGSIPPKGSTIDCSAFITWVLYEYGYTKDFNMQHPTGSFMTTNWNQKYGWEEIDVAAGEDVTNKLQPGDILVRDNGGAGHINITVKVEDGKVYAYDCGDTSATAWNESGGQPLERTRHAKSDSRPGKIIRVTTKPNTEENENED